MIEFIIAIVAIFLALLGQDPVHHVEEGHVAVYWRGGKLMETLAYPGYHALLPFVTKHKTIQGIHL